MGAFTATQNFPYPWIDDPADPFVIQQLATAIDVEVVAAIAEKDIVRQRPVTRVARLASVSVPSNVVTLVAFDTQLEDTHNIWTPGGAGDTRFTCPASQGGVYFAMCSAINFTIPAANCFGLTMKLNGANLYQKKDYPNSNDAAVHGFVKMVPTDYVDFDVWFDAGANATFPAFYASIVKISDT